METITQPKKKQKVKLTSFFSGFNENQNVPFETDRNYPPLVSSAFVSGQLVDTSRNFDELAGFKSEKLHQVLNRFIEVGCAFDVSTDDFQVIDSNRILKTSDREFLELNDVVILCQLQQSLLMKHLFSHSPEQFEDFSFEMLGREAIFSENCLNSSLTKADETPFEIYFEAVKGVTKKWYSDLLDGENKR